MNEHYIFQKHPTLTIGDISALIYNSSESAIYSINLKEVSHVLYSWVARHISRQKPCQIEIKFYLTPL